MPFEASAEDEPGKVRRSRSPRWRSRASPISSGIDAAVLVEAHVLGREDRGAKSDGHLGQVYRADVLPGVGARARQQLGGQRDALDLGASLAEPSDATALDAERHAARASAGQLDIPGRVRARELAGPSRGLRLPVTQATQNPARSSAPTETPGRRIGGAA
jgi:hypothetical protein